AAVASRVKSVRQAIGDDGRKQQFVRTIHGRGYRFVATVRVSRTPDPAISAEPATDSNGAGLAPMVEALDRVLRPSLAVLPFRFVGEERYAALATALPDELIADLSRLHWLFITARGSSFRLSPTNAEFGEIGQLLRVRYCLWGTVEVV